MNCKALVITAFLILTSTVGSAKELLHAKNKTDIKNAINNNKMVVIKYGTKWCGPCQQMDKIIPDLAKEFKEIQFVKVDLEEVKIDEIQSVPFFEFYLDQKKATSFTGSKSKAKFTEIINDTYKCCNTK